MDRYITCGGRSGGNNIDSILPTYPSSDESTPFKLCPIFSLLSRHWHLIDQRFLQYFESNAPFLFMSTVTSVLSQDIGRTLRICLLNLETP